MESLDLLLNEHLLAAERQKKRANRSALSPGWTGCQTVPFHLPPHAYDGVVSSMHHLKRLISTTSNSHT